MRKWISLVVMSVVTVIASGCGSGGNDTGPRTGTSLFLASTDTFNLRSAWVNYVQRPQVLNAEVSGRDTGVPVTGQFTGCTSSLFPATWEGRQAWGQVSTVQTRLGSNGRMVRDVISSIIYYDANLSYLGESGTSYDVVDSPFAFPQSVRVGDTGVLYTTTGFADSSKTSVVGTSRTTYSVEPDTPTSVIVALNTEVTPSDGSLPVSNIVKYRLTTAGVLDRLSEVVTDAGGGVVLALSYPFGQPGSVPGNPPVPTQTFNLRAAYVNDLQRSQSLQADITGNVNGVPVSGTGTATTTGLSQGMFEGRSALAQTSMLDMQLVGNGEPVALTIGSTSYYDAGFNWLGSSGETHERANGPMTIPQSVRAGDGGLVVSATVFEDASRAVVTGTEYTTFAIEPDTAASAILTLNRVTLGITGTVTDSSVAKYRLTDNAPLVALGEIAATRTPAPVTLEVTYRQP